MRFSGSVRNSQASRRPGYICRDAVRLARLRPADDLKPVWVPDESTRPCAIWCVHAVRLKRCRDDCANSPGPFCLLTAESIPAPFCERPAGEAPPVYSPLGQNQHDAQLRLVSARPAASRQNTAWPCVDAPTNAIRIFGSGCCARSGAAMCSASVAALSMAAGSYGSSRIRSTSLVRARSAPHAPGSS